MTFWSTQRLLLGQGCHIHAAADATVQIFIAALHNSLHNSGKNTQIMKHL